MGEPRVQRLDHAVEEGAQGQRTCPPDQIQDLDLVLGKTGGRRSFHHFKIAAAAPDHEAGSS
jgi:hypothetical protein